MRLSRPIAILVLLATFVPIVYMIGFAATVFMAFLGTFDGNDDKSQFRILLLLHFLCIIWVWSLIAVYLVFLFKSKAVPKDQKALWAVVLLMTNMMAMPVFWYLYIWPSTKAPPPTALDEDNDDELEDDDR